MVDLYESLETLVDGWCDAAASLDGYSDKTTTGDSPRLVLTLHRKSTGDLCLEVMSVKDFMRTISPTDLMRLEDLEEVQGIATTTFPYARVTISPEK